MGGQRVAVAGGAAGDDRTHGWHFARAARTNPTTMPMMTVLAFRFAGRGVRVYFSPNAQSRNTQLRLGVPATEKQ
jgi:hypothetical protein